MPQYLPSILARSLFAVALFTGSACVVGAAPAGKSSDLSTDMSTAASTANQTFYFGRYSIQVPTTGVDTWSSYKLIDTNITLVSHDGRRDLPGKVSAAIAEISKLHASGYPAYERTENLDGGGAIVLAKSARYDLTSTTSPQATRCTDRSSKAFHRAAWTRRLRSPKRSTR